MAGLAAQLQQAKLKRQNKQQQQQNQSANVGSVGNVGGSPPGGAEGGPLHCMMSEMARTLARRRARTEECSADGTSTGGTPIKTWERAATLPHRLPANNCNGNSSVGERELTTGSVTPASPRSQRKRFGSASEETILKQVNGGGEMVGWGSAAEWESFKQELMREMRVQISQLKKEILDAMKAEFARR